jgi:plastocyanin
MRTRTLTRPLAALAAGLLVVGLAACGDDDDAADTDENTTTVAPEDTGTEDETRPAGDEGAATVTATDNQYDTASVTAAPGGAVTFVNAGSNPHTITADEDEFDTGRVSGGSQAEVTAPSEPGSYAFHCDVHPAMTGTLVVE